MSTLTTPSQETTLEYINTCSAHADSKWKAAALAAITRLAARQARFSSSDVLQKLEKSEAKTHDLRAIGAVMCEARDLGLIRSVGLVRRNNKNTRGATVLWESRIYQSTSTAHSVPESQ